jgi:cephalosporin hydroxylase
MRAPGCGVLLLVAAIGCGDEAGHTKQERAAPGAPLTREQVIDTFHRLFYHDRSTWPQNTWLGIPTQQNPNDVWITQEILFEVKPDVLVEAGTAAGGSAVLWAMILEQVNPDSRVVTIDIANQSQEARRHPVARERVRFLLGSSTAPGIVDEVRQEVEGKRVLVILDSDHAQHHVAEELELYAPMVSLGSYLIVQDTNVNGHPVFLKHGPGPWEAVEAFLARHSEFEVDESRERLLFTMHPRGYLKRVR